jgi:electron transfer flavoprotein alpha subunit
MANSAGILVLGELEGGALASTAAEILAAGRVLADGLGLQLSMGIAGADAGSAAQDAIDHGADQVYVVNDPILVEYHPELLLEAWAQICRQTDPTVVLMARTTNGRDLAPRLAVRLGVGLAQDCLEVSVDTDSGKMVAHRPVYGGNAMAAVVCTGTPQMASIRPKAYEPLARDSSRRGEVFALDASLDASMKRVKLVERVEEESKGVQLDKAGIVVAGGRGLGSPGPFKDLEVIAGLLGAGLGASRAAVDAGWVPPSWQIGLTGKTITPDLYITVAISGASQHMAGCSGAKVIVAVNKDQEANIFKEARYGVVGDWQKVLPSFTETLRELLK